MVKFCFFRLSIVFICFVQFGEGELYAQQADTLKEVAVTGNRINTVKSDLHPLQVLNGAQLEKLNSQSVAEAIRHFSGVQVKDYGGLGGLKTVNVRSLGSLHTGVFYDGVQLGNAQNGQVDLGRISLDNIETIELYNGSSDKENLPARAYTLANSLYLRTRQPVFTGDRKRYIQSKLRAGSFGLFNPSITWQEKLSGSVYSTASAEWQSSNGRYKFRHVNGTFDSLLTRTNGDLQSLRLEAAVYGRGSDSSRWSVQMYGYRSERGLPRVIVENAYDSRERLWDDEFFSQMYYSKSFGLKYDLSVRGKYGYSYSRYQDPDWLGSSGEISNWYKQQELYLSVAQRYQVTPLFRLAFASDIIRNTLDAEIDFNPTGFPEPTRWTSLLSLTGSLRFKKLTAEANLLGTITSEAVERGQSANNKDAITPAVSVSWKPFSENLNIRAFYKSSFRLPTFNDQYYTLIGNTALKPEYANQYNVGFDYQKTFGGRISFLSFRGDIYQNNVKDKIVAIPTRGLFLWSMMNLGKTRIRGFELGTSSEFRFASRNYLTGNLNYTFQKAVDITPGSFYGKLLPYAPVHAGSANLSLVLNNTSINYSYIYTGERYGLQPNRSDSYLEPWYTSDVSLSYRRAFKERIFKITAGIYNVFDLPYEVVRNYPMPGRSFQIALNTNF
ncbi:TonB-dependent siderophore receptor [Pedobacter sp. SYSU D00535]|uniref:TonB-dependent receptor plug domain-containing protein n=1 Tax=Pedobacter sp. SYSU D00535 TaxID=2810308 RepID=UPI001A97388D|nr:TonB-dependent receptor [Pedobacter sp. SYSU D00535]